MTYYCRIHSDWEGIDLGKLHDHFEKDHSISATTMEEYLATCRMIQREEIFEVHGPNRLSDTQWLKTFSGRMPKIGNLMGQNETEK